MSIVRKLVGVRNYEKLRRFATWVVPVVERRASISRACEVEPGLLEKLWTSILTTMAGIESYLGQLLGPAFQIFANFISAWSSEPEPEQPPCTHQQPASSPGSVLQRSGEKVKAWLGETKDSVQLSVIKLEEAILGWPMWIYAYVLFVVFTLVYLIQDAVSRYRGVQWAKLNQVPQQVT